MAPDDALHRGQADAGAGEFFGGVQPFEGLEELAGMGHVKAGAVVSHVVCLPALIDGDAEGDLCFCLFTGELPGVVQEVL